MAIAAIRPAPKIDRLLDEFGRVIVNLRIEIVAHGEERQEGDTRPSSRQVSLM